MSKSLEALKKANSNTKSSTIKKNPPGTSKPKQRPNLKQVAEKALKAVEAIKEASPEVNVKVEVNTHTIPSQEEAIRVSVKTEHLPETTVVNVPLQTRVLTPRPVQVTDKKEFTSGRFSYAAFGQLGTGFHKN